MAEYGMIIDVAKCNGCYNCMLACKDEFCGHDYPGYSLAQPMTGQFWMRLVEQERGTYPKIKLSYTAIACMHCRNSPCVEKAENDAVYQRDDGIVVIDPEKAKGQKQLVSACPYRVIYWNEALNIPQKCTLCAHLLDQGWEKPRCVEMCPTGAMTFGDLSDPNSEVSQLLASQEVESLNPDYGLKERVRYINVPKKFIAGTVIFQDSDLCAKDAKVTLTSNGTKLEKITDGFGDFWFDGLPQNNKFKIVIEAASYQPITMEATTKNDVNLGEIFLNR